MYTKEKIMEETKKLQYVSHVKNPNVIYHKGLPMLDRVALFATERIGTMGFFFVLAVITTFWIAWNVYAPLELRFDPFPAFVLWLFISNLLQLLLMPLLMIGQNLQGRHSEVRAEADYKLNLQTEREVQQILAHLARQDKLMMELLRRVDDIGNQR